MTELPISDAFLHEVMEHYAYTAQILAVCKNDYKQSRIILQLMKACVLESSEEGTQQVTAMYDKVLALLSTLWAALQKEQELSALYEAVQHEFMLQEGV